MGEGEKGRRPAWEWEEMRQVGTDYTDVAEVERYDRRMGEFRRAGFLTFPCEPGSFDAAVSVAALHHLPDLWKAVALRNIQRSLMPGGRFVLLDVVFSWNGDDHPACFESFIGSFPESTRGGPSSMRHGNTARWTGSWRGCCAGRGSGSLKPSRGNRSWSGTCARRNRWFHFYNPFLLL